MNLNLIQDKGNSTTRSTGSQHLMDSFLYVWTDLLENKLYVGTRKGVPTDGYICSGKLMLEQYKKRPLDFVRQVVATGTYKDMIALECYILKSVDAKKDKNFYNQHNGDGNFYNKGHTQGTKEKLKVARNNRTDKPRLGKLLSEEGKKKASESAKKAALTDGRGFRLKLNRGKNVDYSSITKEVWRKRREGLLPMPKRMKES